LIFILSDLPFPPLRESAGFWGNCKEGEIHGALFDGTLITDCGRIEMKVNNVQVSTVSCFNRCCMLRHEHPDPSEQFRWKANAEGKYDFQIAITGTEEGKYCYMRISSFILV
jgi:hypothetical protein